MRSAKIRTCVTLWDTLVLETSALPLYTSTPPSCPFLWRLDGLQTMTESTFIRLSKTYALWLFVFMRYKKLHSHVWQCMYEYVVSQSLAVTVPLASDLAPITWQCNRWQSPPTSNVTGDKRFLADTTVRRWEFIYLFPIANARLPRARRLSI